MARTPLRVLRATAAQLLAYIGPSAEPSFNTDTKRPHYHDGATPGGIPIAAQEDVRIRGAHIFDYVSAGQHNRIRNGTIDYDMASEIQKGIAETITANCELNLVGGRYPVTNLNADQDPSYDNPEVVLGVKMPRLIGRPGTVIQKLNGGDNRYLFASRRWAQPIKSGDGSVAYGQGPIAIDNIIFDGAGIAQDVFVNAGYQSEFTNVHTRGGLRDGLVEAVTAIDGTPMTGRSASRYSFLKSYRNGRFGFNNPYSGSCYITDGQLIFPFLWDNGINLDMGQSAGWQIHGAHTWNHGLPPMAGATYSARIAGGKALEIVGGDFEGYGTQTYGLQLETVDGDIEIGHARLLEGLGLNAIPASPFYSIAVNDCRFVGATSRLRHGYSAAGSRVLSSGNSFEVSDGYAFLGGAGHAGSLIADKDRLGNDGLVYSGRQRHQDYAVTTPSGIEYASALPYSVGISSPTTLIVSTGAPITTNQSVVMPAARRGMRYTIIRSDGGDGLIMPKKSDGTTDAGIAYIAKPSAYGAGWTAVSVTAEFDGVAWRTVSIAQAQI